MTEFFQFLVGGISAGLIFSLIGIGWVWVYSTSGILNLAQGSFVTLGGFTFVAFVDKSAPLWLSIILVVVVCGIAGVLCDVLSLRWIRQSDPLAMILVTLGLATVLHELQILTFGPSAVTTDPLIAGPPVSLHGVSVSLQALLLWVITILLLASVAAFFSRTRFGRASRACADNPLAARLVGINPSTIRVVAIAGSAVIAGLGGLLLAPLTATSADAGLSLGIQGFVAAAIGGMYSYLRTALGGLAIGIAQALFAGYVSSEFSQGFTYILLLAALIGMAAHKYGFFRLSTFQLAMAKPRS